MSTRIAHIFEMVIHDDNSAVLADVRTGKLFHTQILDVYIFISCECELYILHCERKPPALVS